MKPFLGLCLAAAILIAAPRVSAEIVDAIAATVDKEVILRSDLMFEVGPLLQTLPANEVEAAIRQALDQAVEFKVLYREALLFGVTVTNEEVEERLQNIVSQYPSYDEFLTALTDAGETVSDFRERMRKQIMAIRMGLGKRALFAQEAVISEGEMAQYYQDNIDEFSRPERVRVQRIFLPAGNDATEREKTRARLEALREEAELGADFSELAKSYSEGPDADSGGVMGWVNRGDLVPALDSAVFALAEGEVSAPVETEFGFQILRAVEKDDAGLATFDQVRTEIEPKLREAYALERYEKWVAELRKRSRVRIFL